MLHAQHLFYIHILYTQKGVYSIFEYKTNFEREAFRFSMLSIYQGFKGRKGGGATTLENAALLGSP